MKNKKHYTIPVFIPEVACPFQCVYCNQQRISGRQTIPGEKEVVRIIEDHMKTISWKEHHVELGFFGGSFTGLPSKDQSRYLMIAQPYLNRGIIRSIRLSTRPDYIDSKNLKMLSEYGVETIELGAQSMDNEVLRLTRRDHTVEDTIKASQMIRESDIRLGLQMMIGLPGDTKEKTIETAKKMIELKADDIRIYPLLVIKGTLLHDWYNAGKYTPLNPEEAIDRCKAIVPMFETAGVNIIRIGLHPSDELLDGSSIIAGPFHVSFRELVMTEIWNDRLKPLLEQTGKKLNIYVAPHEKNFAIGHKARNKKMLEKKFSKVKFLESHETGSGNFRFIIEK